MPLVAKMSNDFPSSHQGLTRVVGPPCFKAHGVSVGFSPLLSEQESAEESLQAETITQILQQPPANPLGDPLVRHTDCY